MAAHCDFLAGVFSGMKNDSKHDHLIRINFTCNWKKHTNYCHFFCIWIGACNMFISHPLDTVKMNMQSGNMRFIQATRVLFKTEGVCVTPHSPRTTQFSIKLIFNSFWQAKSYYRGLLFPLCSTGFLNSIIFGVYGNSFRIYQNM